MYVRVLSNVPVERCSVNYDVHMHMHQRKTLRRHVIDRIREMFVAYVHISTQHAMQDKDSQKTFQKLLPEALDWDRKPSEVHALSEGTLWEKPRPRTPPRTAPRDPF